jgi:HEAT repeat protein
MKSRMSHVLVAVMVLAGAAAAFGAEAAVSARDEEAKLIAVLKSEAGQKEKADACRELGRIGTGRAVAPLVALLGDEKLSHMARYGLETIPGPAVDTALRNALGNVKGRILVGVIGSLGVRRDAKAVGALAQRLTDPDADVAQAAARALGKIGTPEAAKAITGALDGVAATNQVAFCEGLFRCAETLAAQGKADEAVAIYDRLRDPKGPQQVRAGALRGAILMRQDKGLPLLMEAIRGDDFVLVGAAARTAMEMPGAEVTQALAGELEKLSADKKILVIQTLGKRGDAAAVPALVAATKSGEKTVRLEAVRALPMIGDAAGASPLAKLMGDADADIAKAAQESLVALPGEKVEAAIAAMLTDPDAKTRAVGVDLLGQRRVVSAMPALLKAAEDGDESVRIASLKVLGAMGGEAQLQPVLGLLTKAKSPGELQAAEAALAAICVRQSKPVAGKVVILKAAYGDLPSGPQADVTKQVAELVKAGTFQIEASNGNFGDPAEGKVKKLSVEYTVDGKPGSGTVAENETLTIAATVTLPACTDALCAALAKAEGPAKLALLRVVGSGGGAKALEAVRAASADSSAETRDAALRVLCEWPTADALPDLAKLAKTAADAKIKTLALRGYIRLAPQQDGTVEKKLASLKDAIGLAERNEEKKLVLAALRGIPTAESLALVTPHLATADLKEEASLAAVGIAEKILQTHAAQVAEAMEKVSTATSNEQVAKRAKELLKAAQAKTGGK